MRLGGTSPARRDHSGTSLTGADLPKGQEISSGHSPTVLGGVWGFHACRYTDGFKGPFQGPAPARFFTNGASYHNPAHASPSSDPWGLADYFVRHCGVRSAPRIVHQFSISEAGNPSGYCSSTGGQCSAPTLPSTVPRKAGGAAPPCLLLGLTVATPGISVPAGGRSSFATNPFIARPAGRSQSAGAHAEDSDKAVTSDISKLAKEASRKRHFEEGEGG